jgi:hypothetical protein
MLRTMQSLLILHCRCVGTGSLVEVALGLVVLLGVLFDELRKSLSLPIVAPPPGLDIGGGERD